MAEKLFLLGRPGSGKSTVRHYITKMAQHKFWSPYPICDTRILQNMCAADRKHVHIRPAEFGGFEVLDFSILDNALKIIEGRVEKALERHEFDWPRIAIIEFARNDYVQSLSHFDPTFIKDAHFLVLESDVDTCMERIYERTRYPMSVDDTFVPVKIMENYYQKDTLPDLTYDLQEAFGLNDHQIQVMSADGPCDEFLHDCVKVYFQSILDSAFKARGSVRTSSISRTSNIVVVSSHCPPPLQEIRGGVEVYEQVDDTIERELVTSSSN